MKFLDALVEVNKEFIRMGINSYLKGMDRSALSVFNDNIGLDIREYYGMSEEDSLLLLTVLWKEHNG